MSDCRIRISDSRRRIVGLAILSDSDSDSDRIGILCSDSDSDFGLNLSDRIDEKLISDPTGNTTPLSSTLPPTPADLNFGWK